MANVGKVNMNNNICLNHNLYLAIRKTCELVWKKESSPCWFGASIKIHPNLYLYFVSPKWKIWLWRPKSIPAERKRIHTIIHKPQQVLEKKEKQSATCTKTITKTKKSNFPKLSPYSWKITMHKRSTHKKQSSE